MKKSLLAFAAALTMGFSAYADTAEVTFSALNYGNGDDVTEVKVGNDITLTFGAGTNTSNTPKYYNTGTAVRLYGGNEMTVSAAAGFEITDIAFTVGSSNKWNAESTADPAGFDTDKTAWTGAASEIKFTQGGTSGHVRIEKMVITYNSVAPETVAAPTFELVAGQWGGYAVKMTTATEGAEIRYTMTDWNGNAPADPTVESNLYTEPVDVWGKTEFKAIAVKDGETSRVATFEVNPPQVIESFGDLLGIDAEWAGTKIEISNVTVLAQHGRYLLLSSGYNNMMVFGTLTETFKPGDVISKLSATIAFYGNTVQLTNPEFGTVTEGEAPAVKEGFVDMVAANNMYSYFTIKNATIAAGTGTGNYTLTTEDGEVVLHNNFYNTKYDDYIEIPEGAGFSVTGYVYRYFEDLQFCPMEAPTGGVVEQQTATPVITPEAGELNEGDFITITCETEGAKIYYTTDDTTPTVESTLYTEPIEFTGDAMTVTAIAIAEGMVESKPAQATFTKKIIEPVEGNTATFNFTAPAELNPAQTAPTSSNNGVVVSDVVFKNNGISFTATKGSGDTSNARLWITTKDEIQLRVYKGATLTINSQDGYAIEKIDFEGASNVKAIQYKGTAVSDNGTKGTWEATEDIQEVKFDVVGANPYLTLITVTFKDVSGVSDIEFDANAPVEFYNLQGVRMNGDLTPGLYIRRQGNKATKVLVK